MFDTLEVSNSDKSYYECFLNLFIEKRLIKETKDNKTYWQGRENFSYPLIFNEILIINLKRGPLNSFFPKLSLDKTTNSKEDENIFIKKNDSYYYIDIIDLIDMLLIPEPADKHYGLINDIIKLLKEKYKNKIYRIYSLVMKSGDVNSGHYYSYNFINGKYWDCNDDEVEELNLDVIDNKLVNSDVEGFIRSLCLEMRDSPN